ncbi:MAG: OmpA family protein [PVC group bacterium]
MRMFVIAVVCVPVLAGLGGCSSTPEPTATPEERMAALEGMDLPLAPLDMDAAFGEPRPEDALVLQDIHFDFDKSEIRNSEKPLLDPINTWLLEHPGALLMIEGHCDDRGTLEYNLALGERRALSIRTYLTGLGTNPERLHTISYGEEKPLCTEAVEECWLRNRRGHFLVDYGDAGRGNSPAAGPGI